MKNYASACIVLVLAAFAVPVGLAQSTPPLIVLAGDSTVTDASGWGAGFRELLANDAECINLAKSGRSSRSFRSEGWWQKCMDAQPDFLLIQFGHNDQPGKGASRESAAATDFRDHLRKFIEETQKAGCQPILVTPLTRRRWDDDGKIIPTLSDYAEATLIVAQERGVPLLDLHRLSIEQCNALGPEAFRVFEPMTDRGADHTHLNDEGGRAVGKLVARELVALVPELAKYVDAARLKNDVPNGNVRLANEVSGLQLVETDETISISRGDAAIIVYNKKSPPVPDGIDPVYHRSGFLHPVATPKGRVVTAAFPADHPHQHGIFSAWVRTKWNDREIDFWNLAGGTGRVLHQRVVSTFSDDTATGFEVDMAHRATETPIVDVLRERWKVSVYPTDEDYFCFDIETTQTAASPLPLTVNKYHYGGVALRGPTEWVTTKDRDKTSDEAKNREPSFFLNDRGSDRIKGNHEHARWVVLSGKRDGGSVSISVLSHVDNFRAPQAARLHPTKPYFCFGPCIDDEFVIDSDHPYHGKYRYLVTDAKPDAKWLNEQWNSWCGK